MSDGVPFYRHDLGEVERASLLEALTSLFLTTGPRTAEFERRFAEYLGVDHAVGVSSCTTALILGLQALGVGEGDEVITTPMTFIATSNAVIHVGATPVFVDVEPDTGHIDVAQVSGAITPRTKVILPVHLYGQMVDMKALRALADAHGLSILEDCAHAVESSRDGVRPAALGDAACFSFYATKNMTSGEGGAVATSREDIAESVRLMRNHGMSKNAYERYTGTYQHWDMIALGHKANLYDLQAALLLPQLDAVDDRLARRARIAAIYDQAFTSMEGVDIVASRPDTRLARHLYTIWVDRHRRDEILTSLQTAGIGVAVNYRAVHLLTYYREKYGFAPGAFPEAERIGDRTISLPMFPSMTEAQAHQVIDAVARSTGR
jgi:UDP-4-amino-4-deoxy-L-arabinose-oxoglutarate aminotransferase